MPRRRFFIVPMAPKLSEQAGFLHLLFDAAQGKADVVIVYFHDDHRITNDRIGEGAQPEVSPD